LNSQEQNTAWAALNAMARELAPKFGSYDAGFAEACQRLPEAASKIGQQVSSGNGGQGDRALGTAKPWREIMASLGAKLKPEDPEKERIYARWR
jgi:hypothetical protein